MQALLPITAQCAHCMHALLHSKLQLPIRRRPCCLSQLSVPIECRPCCPSQLSMPIACWPCCLSQLNVPITCWPCYLTFSHTLRCKLHYTDFPQSSLKLATPRLRHNKAFLSCQLPLGLRQRQEKTKQKTTPFGVNLMRNQVLYRAAQGSEANATSSPRCFVNHITILTIMMPHPWTCFDSVPKCVVFSFVFFLNHLIIKVNVSTRS